MAVAMRISSEVDSMSTSGLYVCRALSVERQPPFAPPHGRGCHTDRALAVLCKVVYRHSHVTSDYMFHTTLMLAATSGAMETAWLSFGGAYKHRAHEMWALFRSNPVELAASKDVIAEHC